MVEDSASSDAHSSVNSKSSLRRVLRERRLHRTADESKESARSLADTALTWLDGLTGSARPDWVASFAPSKAEPPVGELNARLSHRLTVLLPICQPDHGLLWAPWTPTTPLRRSPIEPVSEPDIEDANDAVDLVDLVGQGERGVLLLPALAVDTNGARLGQGGGYYDRLLARLRGLDNVTRPTLAAVVFDDEVLEPGAFPVDSHDEPVDFIIAENRVIGVGSGPQ